MKHICKFVFATVFSLTAVAAFAIGENDNDKGTETAKEASPEPCVDCPEAEKPAPEVQTTGGCGCSHSQPAAE